MLKKSLLVLLLISHYSCIANPALIIYFTMGAAIGAPLTFWAYPKIDDFWDRRSKRNYELSKYETLFKNKNLYHISPERIEKISEDLIYNHASPFDVLIKVNFDSQNPLYLEMKRLKKLRAKDRQYHKMQKVVKCCEENQSEAKEECLKRNFTQEKLEEYNEWTRISDLREKYKKVAEWIRYCETTKEKSKEECLQECQPKLFNQEDMKKYNEWKEMKENY
ncbi:hypothetical protein A3F66_05755 [candidate division TM6 bacterium RIFCSPHIGHO2_12_FULL_32_22]|nr:MAG: hypothetical protein A3F66_05755 [candidate division TM6 bacterium RIFCSPHIGHO2_12_FULL_32_22]